MGAHDWNFNADACGDIIQPILPTDPERNITCNCEFVNNTCHITALVIKRYSLPGQLPPELIQLPYLERIDFAYNYLNGSIPSEWASLQLKFISLLANRLSGNVPSYLENFTSLTYLNLELNQFSGTIPGELGKLVKLEDLILSSNKFSGNLPMELAELKNLTDFRINDNNFNGSIPDFIQNWKQLNRLVLRSCNISGEIPLYIWQLGRLRILDLSFNKIRGELPNAINTETLVFIFLTGNFLSGNIPLFRKGTNVDLSYNNFTRQSTEQPACKQIDLSLNLFRSSSMGNDIGGACANNFSCDQYWHSLYINCGGDSVKINGKTYEGDVANGGAALLYPSNDDWGVSSTGDFMDDNDFQNKAYVENSPSLNIDELYRTARLSPLSLAYYRQCLENGDYTVSLHFAEIQFTNDSTYSSLGRRMFDIYIQNDRVQKDFNIEDKANGVAKPVIEKHNATVTNNILEIRFFWAGKGTTRVPVSGVYGPLISAISVDPNFEPPSGGGKTKIAPIIAGVVGSFLILLALSIIVWRRYFRAKDETQKDFQGLESQTVSFTLKQIRAATNNFDPANKIGEGGFGPVYKGLFSDGTVIAVKQLSSKSSQGNREFLNEIGMISCLQHPNLVKLHGCCIEGNQLLLVYEYLENNSLARALFGPEHCQIKLDWQTRQRICVGIARGLAFLHEESRLKIVHRDIKATNVLLDKHLNPKISDFGLAKLDTQEKTHISTRIAGTIGYMAPEYALWGYLTHKADVYSFGIVALEIVGGKHNMNYGPENKFACLLDWACHLQQSGNLMELVDEKLGSDFKKVEAERMIKAALLCTNASPSLRPTMSEVVSMLEGTRSIPDVIPEASSYNEDLRFKAIREHKIQMISQSERGSQECNSTSVGSEHDYSAASANDLYEINEESYMSFKARKDHHKHMENQVSTSFSITASSSTSAHDLYDFNLNSQ
ncbi:hypothetical protein GH714_011742 [Hevea brasiliensis]|uniref:non-specific serine/threonine protein kinase n=1 Tax=Hevea brasiliensis TaxID=3981 RepID=A0A6A6LRR8_HEVBR|nr:hypothetical protein GH714_011742 [Hevea brasiliensis]